MSQYDELRKIAQAATSGPWRVRHFDADEAETRRFAEAVRLSAEHNPDTGARCYRLIAGDDACLDEGGSGDWLNLAFYGNGPCSQANAVFAAVFSPDVVLELLDELDHYERRAALPQEQTGEVR